MPPTFDHQTGQISAFVSRGERTLAKGGQPRRKSRSVRATVFGFAKFAVLEKLMDTRDTERKERICPFCPF